MGVDLASIEVPSASQDLSDRGVQLKGAVQDRLDAVSSVTGSVRNATQHVSESSEEAGRAIGEVASAMTDVAQGAERQARMVDSARDVALRMAETVSCREAVDNRRRRGRRRADLSSHRAGVRLCPADERLGVRDRELSERDGRQRPEARGAIRG